MRTVVGISLLFSVAAAASTQAQTSTVALPDGCEGLLTVQLESCEVEHTFSCESDPDGHRRLAMLDQSAITLQGLVDADGKWLWLAFPVAGYQEELLRDAADHYSLADFVSNGFDTYDFQTMSDEVGLTRYVGEDRLTGRFVEIDGLPLEEVEVQYEALDDTGGLIFSERATQYFSHDLNLFFFGTGTTTSPEGVVTYSQRPAEFSFPGDVGFLSLQPKYGCGDAIS